MAPFILAFSDLNRFVLRDEPSNDPHQRLVNEHTHEDDHHWPWYLEDLTKLGFDRSSHVDAGAALVHEGRRASTTAC